MTSEDSPHITFVLPVPGEELRELKVNGQIWIPKRHADVLSAQIATLQTSLTTIREIVLREVPR